MQSSLDNWHQYLWQTSRLVLMDTNCDTTSCALCPRKRVGKVLNDRFNMRISWFKGRIRPNNFTVSIVQWNEPSFLRHNGWCCWPDLNLWNGPFQKSNTIVVPLPIPIPHLLRTRSRMFFFSFFHSKNKIQKKSLKFQLQYNWGEGEFFLKKKSNQIKSNQINKWVQIFFWNEDFFLTFWGAANFGRNDKTFSLKII